MKNLLLFLLIKAIAFQLAIGLFFPLNANSQQSTQNSLSLEISNSYNFEKIRTDDTKKTDDNIINACSVSANNVSNGITVTEVKPYDERTLIAMLNEYERSLAQIKYPELSALYQNIDRFQGNTARSTALSANISNSPLPSIVTATGAVNNSGQTSNSTTGGTTTETNNQTSGSNTTQTITQSGVAPVIPTLPAASPGAFPGSLGYGLSPQDAVESYTALTYQILNLRSLLNQSYADRLISFNDGLEFKSRAQTFIGFTVNIEPKFAKAVAEVDITVRPQDSQGQADSNNKMDPRVSVISLFPEEKTYNVAKITDDKKSLGGAFVSPVSIGAAGSKSNSTMYLVQDTDTVGFQRQAIKQKIVEKPNNEKPNNNANSNTYVLEKLDVNGNVTTKDEQVAFDKEGVRFVWQFRPVLGEPTVKGGARKVFALLAIPQESGDSENWTGKFTIQTQWKKIKDKGIVEDYPKRKGNGLYSACEGTLVVPSLDKVEKALNPVITGANWVENGNGLVTIIADGRNFRPDTQIIIGNKIYSNQSDELRIQNDKRLVLTTSAQTIANFEPMILGRYGNTKLGDITNNSKSNPYNKLIHAEKPEFSPKDSKTTLVTIKLKPKDEPDSQSKLTLKNRQKPDVEPNNKENTESFDLFRKENVTPPVIQIGDSLFGLSNAPYKTKQFNENDNSTKLTFEVPNEVLKENKQIIVRELVNNNSRIEIPYEPEKINFAFSVSKVQKLADDKEDNPKHMQIVVYGTGLDKGIIKLVAGSGPAESPIPDIGSKKMQIFKVPIKTKNIIITQGDNDPVYIDLDKPTPFPAASISIETKNIEIKKGDSKQINLKGANFDSIKSIFFENISLSFKPDKTNTSMDLYIPSALTSETGEKHITIVMKDDERVSFTLLVK